MQKRLFKMLLVLGFLTSVLNLNAQDKKNTFGIGFQSSFPIYGLSAKYAITENSVVQATIAPFGIGNSKINFYGGRYIYRFTSETNLDPYIFGGAGLISFTTDFTAFGGTKTTDNFFSYSAGGGIEYIAVGALGLSADLGYGKFTVSNDAGVAGIFLGVGIHYYIK